MELPSAGNLNKVNQIDTLKSSSQQLKWFVLQIVSAADKDLVFRCLPSADLRILKDITRPVYICRAEGRVLALAFDTFVPNDAKELHVVLEPDTLKKFGEVFVTREKRTVLGDRATSSSAASSSSFGLGIGNPFGILLGNPAPLISGGLSTAHAQSSAEQTSGFFG